MYTIFLSILVALAHLIILKTIDFFGQMIHPVGKIIAVNLSIITIGVCLWSIIVSMALVAQEDSEAKEGEE